MEGGKEKMGGVTAGQLYRAEEGVIQKVAGSAVAISSAVTQWTVKHTDRQTGRVTDRRANTDTGRQAGEEGE